MMAESWSKDHTYSEAEQEISDFTLNPIQSIGDVTYNMLIEQMSIFDIAYSPKGCRRRFAWFVAVFRMSEMYLARPYDEKTLFLCHAEDAPALLDAHPGCFCITVGEVDKTSEATNPGQSLSWIRKNRYES